MTFNKRPCARSIALVTALILFSSSSPTPATHIESLSFVPPTPPPQSDRGAPSGRRVGGSSRSGKCPVSAVGKQLTALVPETSMPSKNKVEAKDSTLKSEKLVWGLTVDASPTLWFYVPYALTPKLSMEFLLQDEEGKEVYDSPVQSKTTPAGVVSLPLSATAVTLKVGKMYHWYFLINCGDPDELDASSTVDGWVKRVDQLNPTLASQLQGTKPQERVALYAKNGLWYDAVTALAKLRSVHPEDAKLNNDWVSLLGSVDLSGIASEPIAQCCTLVKSLPIDEGIKALFQLSTQEQTSSEGTKKP